MADAAAGAVVRRARQRRMPERDPRRARASDDVTVTFYASPSDSAGGSKYPQRIRKTYPAATAEAAEAAAAAEAATSVLADGAIDAEAPTRTRSGRVSRPPQRYEPVEVVVDDFSDADDDSSDADDLSSDDAEQVRAGTERTAACLVGTPRRRAAARAAV